MVPIAMVAVLHGTNGGCLARRAQNRETRAVEIVGDTAFQVNADLTWGWPDILRLSTYTVLSPIPNKNKRLPIKLWCGALPQPPRTPSKCAPVANFRLFLARRSLSQRHARTDLERMPRFVARTGSHPLSTAQVRRGTAIANGRLSPLGGR
jgi:hypothetical protein